MGKENEVRGYSLFNELEDPELRRRNQCTTICNILENRIDHSTKRVTPWGADLVMQYFNKIDEEDRDKVEKRVYDELVRRGLLIG